MDQIVSISAQAVDLPLKEAFETAQRRAEVSATVFVKVILEDGTTGYGEATPVRYVTGEDQETVVAAVDRARETVVGRPPGEYRLIARELLEVIPSAKSARNGIETAILDAFGKLCGVPVYSLLGGRRGRIETDVTIPVVPPDHAGELAARAAERGFRLFKVKVGGPDRDADFRRVLAISSVSPEFGIIADANQGFRPDEAVSFVDSLTSKGVRFVLLEQPVKKEDIDGLKWVHEHTDVPVFADEAAQGPSDVMNLARRGAVSGVNVKLMKAGILGALDIVSICRAGGLRLMLGCMLESAVGAAASLHVACGTEAFSHFDLDSDQLLAGRPVEGGFVREGGCLEPVEKPGFGCEVREVLGAET